MADKRKQKTFISFDQIESLNQYEGHVFGKIMIHMSHRSPVFGKFVLNYDIFVNKTTRCYGHDSDCDIRPRGLLPCMLLPCVCLFCTVALCLSGVGSSPCCYKTETCLACQEGPCVLVFFKRGVCRPVRR